MNEDQQKPLDQLDGEDTPEEVTEEVTQEDVAQEDVTVTQGEVTQSDEESVQEETKEEEVKEAVEVVPPQVQTAPPMPPQPVNETPRAVPEEVQKDLSEPDFRIIANKRREETHKRLMGQTKVWFMIPISHGEAQGLSYESVTIDGLRMEVKKGVMVELPKQVAEILAEKYNVELNAGRSHRIDGNQEKLNALS